MLKNNKKLKDDIEQEISQPKYDETNEVIVTLSNYFKGSKSDLDKY